MRLWKADFASKRVVRVELRPKAGAGSPLRLEPPATGAYFTDYAACPAGDMIIAFLGNDGTTELTAPVPASLSSNTFATLLLRERDGQPVLEIINDSSAENEADSAEFTVRNFARGLVEIRVQAGEQLTARMRAPASFLNMRGLERQRCQIDTTTRDEAGKESRWTTEVNFAAARKATLLIHADAYGRIRPRIALDGQTSPASSTPAPTTTENSTTR